MVDDRGPRRRRAGAAAEVPWGDGRGEGGLVRLRGSTASSACSTRQRCRIRWNIVDKNVAFLVDVPSLAAYHAVYSREPRQTPAYCTHHTEPLHQKLQA